MTKTTKIVIGIIIVIIAIAGIWYGITKKSTEKGSIKIGIVGHFTGDYASYGVPMKNAAELAVGQINNSGGINGRSVNLVIEDDASDSKNAASAINKLINVDRVNYIVSAQASGATSAVTPIAQNSKHILMITLGSAPDLTKAGDYIFRSVISDVYQGVKIADFIKNGLKAQKVAGLYVNDPYGVGIRELVNEDIKNIIGDQEMFEAGASDFRTQLFKIKNDGADTLVLVSRKETPIILRQIKELGLSNLRIIAAEAAKDEEILKQAGVAAEGMYVAFMAQPEDFVNFASEYKSKFNEEPSAYSTYAYDGTFALLKAIKDKGDDVEKIKNGLLNISFNGASGKFALNKNRERTGMKYIIYKVQNGQFIPLENH